jgi:DNA-binding CsgD family transcriptional regulator
MSDGVHAELALKPRAHCPLGRVVADYVVQQFVPAGTDTPPQVVLDADSVAADDENAADEGVTVGESALRAVEATKETVICRLVDPDREGARPHEQDEGDWSCPRCSLPCPTAGFDFLPLRPYDHSVTGEWLRLTFAAVDESTLRACLRRLDDAGRAVSLETLRAEPDEEVDDARTVLVDLSDLTTRQRETAALAVRQGYFESDGVSAAELADQLDVSKGTVSEHLRAVRAKVGRQLFPAEDA